MFYSPSTKGFYSEDVHGHRKVKIIDPAWVRPEIDGEPDMAAVPDMLEIDNPDCKIPPDAVDGITAEEHAALLEAQAAGMQIMPGPDGYPIAVPPPPPSANDVIKGQISALEASVTPRRMREAVLGIDGGWLANVNQQIADLRAQLS